MSQNKALVIAYIWLAVDFFYFEKQNCPFRCQSFRQLHNLFSGVPMEDSVLSRRCVPVPGEVSGKVILDHLRVMWAGQVMAYLIRVCFNLYRPL